jgi:hypothetical protein
MTTANVREKKVSEAFEKTQLQNKTGYEVAGDSMTVKDKLEVLEELGRKDLVELFKDWKPRTSNRKKRGAPLDQRISITVTTSERIALDEELKSVKAAGEKITMSQFIRNRALGSVDINGWRAIAADAFTELEDTAKNQVEIRKRKRVLAGLIEEEDDSEQIALLEQEIGSIDKKLEKIVAQNEKRNNRLSGRMSMAESETIKWRAQQLCVSSSDYLRMMIFGLEPDSSADSHMSLDAKRRFYISIMKVANEGWGEPPTIYQCSQCENYMDEIMRLRDEVAQLRTFV